MDNENQKLMQSTQLLSSFWNVQKNLIRLVQKSAIENGLSVPQFSILMAITLHKQMTQKTVGERTFLPKSTLSQGVEGLVREGLIDRQQVEGNRRETLLSLTKKGEKLICTIHQQEGGIHQVFQSVGEILTKKQYEDLLESHQQITTYLETEAPELEQGECKQ